MTSPSATPLARQGIARTLPVSGAGALAGIARSVAGDVARATAEDAVVERVQREVNAHAASGERAQAAWAEPSAGVAGLTALRRASAMPAAPEAEHHAAGAPERDEQRREQWMKVATSDAFRDRLLEFLEDRLLGEIERRGGRYGGWFA